MENMTNNLNLAKLLLDITNLEKSDEQLLSEGYSSDVLLQLREICDLEKKFIELLNKKMNSLGCKITVEDIDDIIFNKVINSTEIVELYNIKHRYSLEHLKQKLESDGYDLIDMCSYVRNTSEYNSCTRDSHIIEYIRNREKKQLKTAVLIENHDVFEGKCDSIVSFFMIMNNSFEYTKVIIY